MSFGIKTSQIGLTYDQIQAIWREADQIDVFEHAWLWDHLIPIRGNADADALEAWTLLAALAAQTSRLRLGVIVTSNRLRSPTLLAKMAATVDVIANGRLDFGIGAGGSRVPGPNPAVREFAAYGFPLVTPGQAVKDLAEALDVITRLWTTEQPFDYDGPSLTLRGAICAPRPTQRPHPPIMVAGAGDRMLRIVAEHADIWNYPGGLDEAYATRNAKLIQHCHEIGRDPATITRSMQLIVRATEPDAAQKAQDTIRQMIDADIKHIVIAAALTHHNAQWLANEVIHPLT
ncbi:LLM class flavin-dependent oxidoreductase [Paractinoplanes durhamensis]|uniref:LLM class flavin-dependent oxidoreductase n=1 Tax=Paractinoplanes durhamensis TaxID=113563 RepID=UPI003637B58B